MSETQMKEEPKVISEQMSKDATKALLTLMMLPDETAEEMIGEDNKLPGLLAIIVKRNTVLKLGLDPKVMVFGSCIVQNPAMAVVFIYDILTKLNYAASLEDVCNDLYPMGFYNDESAQSKWYWLKDNRKDLPPLQLEEGVLSVEELVGWC